MFFIVMNHFYLLVGINMLFSAVPALVDLVANNQLLHFSRSLSGVIVSE